MNKTLGPKSSHLQMVFLGFVSLTVGIVCMLDVVFVYGLPPLTSISESATTGSRAGMLLPFALGCMFTYGIAYVGYCRSERKLVRGMALAFAVAAMQLCDSPYLEFDRVGLLGLSHTASNWVHFLGSAIGFGAMFLWIAFFFTRGSLHPTPEKRKRNEVYRICATLMAAGILLLALGALGWLGPYSVFLAEELMLLPAGVALLVKGGLFLRDK